jgi:exopolysaccharide biosynthesis polyprenyl glycosylphosphotransferase
MDTNKLVKYQSKHFIAAYITLDLLSPLLLLFISHSFFSYDDWKISCLLLGSVAGVSFTLSTQILGGYSRYSQRSIARKLEITFKTWFFNVTILMAIAYFNFKALDFGRTVMVIWIFATPLFIFLLKIIVSNISNSFNCNRITAVILGDSYQFTDFEMNRFKRQNIDLITVPLSELMQLKNEVDKLSPDYLVINSLKCADDKLIKDLVNLNLHGVRLMALNHFMESFLRKCYIPYESTDLSYLEQVRSYSKLNYLLKRTVDLASVFIIGSLILPIVFFTIIKIKKGSPGPIIFSQLRVGMLGREHTIYKFRSMHVDAEKNGAQFAKKNDPRTYQFGAFIRKVRIDELPQLWNVLKGNLHFVGPRPERKFFTSMLEIDIPYYNERHLVKPGITGWAQVLYPYGSTTDDARQKLMYDLYYIKHWSIWLEIETLIHTLFVILGRKGL